MAKRSTMTAEEAVREIGVAPGLGLLRVTSANRASVRKWLAAMGVPRKVSDFLPLPTLQAAYNNEGELDALWAKVALYEDEGEVEEAEADEKEEATPLTMSFKPGSVERAIEELVKGTAARAVDADTVRAIVKEELAGQAPRKIEVVSVNGSKVVGGDKRLHPIFDKLVKLAAQNAAVMIVGPAGCGKTYVCQKVAEALGRRFGMISGSAGASEGMLTGWRMPGEGMKFEYTPSEFVNLYEGGNSFFLFDEFDAFDGNMLLTANAALANGHMHIPHRVEQPSVIRGQDVAIFATANTYGTGADPIYAGRNALDGATLDRFVVLEMDYDREVERVIATQNGIDAEQLGRFWELRERVQTNKLRRVVSTRGLDKIAVLMRTGLGFGDALKALTVGWTRDEKSRVGM